MLRAALNVFALVAACYTFVSAYDPAKKPEYFGTDMQLDIRDDEGKVTMIPAMGVKYCRILVQCEHAEDTPLTKEDPLVCDYEVNGQKVVCQIDRPSWARIEKLDDKGNATYFEFESGRSLVIRCKKNTPIKLVNWQLHTDAKIHDSRDFAWRRSKWNLIFPFVLMAAVLVVAVTTADTLWKWFGPKPLASLERLSTTELADLIHKVGMMNPADNRYAREVLALWIASERGKATAMHISNFRPAWAPPSPKNDMHHQNICNYAMAAFRTELSNFIISKI